MNRTTGWRIAGALLGLAAAAESVAGVEEGWRYALVLCLLALATTVPLALPHPAPAAVIVTVTSLVALLPLHSLTVAGLCAQVLVLYRLARAGNARLAAVLITPFPVVGLIGLYGVRAVLMVMMAPTAAWVGVAVRNRREAQVHRAARQAIAGTLLEHTARGERARIARELHDVVAHHISMIAVQAEAARLTTPGMPPAGAQRLAEIGDTARTCLTEMRRLLGVLREDAEAEVAERHPQPGLQQLNELLDETRDAYGAGARLIIAGPPATLDPGVELAAYRIIQEALTNARRHAAGAAVDVELLYTDDMLRVRVRDNGPGPPDPGSGLGTGPGSGSERLAGHGLPGMRERAAAVGGELRTGPAAMGGFLVEAMLPLKVEAI